MLVLQGLLKRFWEGGPDFSFMLDGGSMSDTYHNDGPSSFV
jgi:hypothetical protein